MCFSSSKTHQLKVASVQFGLLSADEVQRLSVAQICSEVPYDENGNPHFSGVNDPRLGTISRDYRCITCKGSKYIFQFILTYSFQFIACEECPGHFGHIELAKKVYHANLLAYAVKVLRSVCFNCSKLMIARDKTQQDYKLLSACKSSK